MRIKSVDTVTLKIPFSDLYDGPRAKRRGWTEFDTLLVRIETEDGLTGWGEAFAYGCASAVGALIRDTVAPLVIGQEITDVAAFTLKLQQDLHIWGRYGITIFAISGVDIALWIWRRKPPARTWRLIWAGACVRKSRLMPAWCATVAPSRSR
jgi:L-alanine-DL-glutamate epimerase-like enolase superfamily enzyme